MRVSQRNARSEEKVFSACESPDTSLFSQTPETVRFPHYKAKRAIKQHEHAFKFQKIRFFEGKAQRRGAAGYGSGLFFRADTKEGL